MKSIAVIITVYNRKNTTLECLKRLFEINMPDDICLDVYLTDDGCTDGTAEAVNLTFPKVHVIKGDGDLYWNRGMWTAWNEAAKNDYDYFLWLNDDTELYSNAIEILIELSKAQDDKAIIVGLSESTDHTHVTYGGRINGKIPLPQGKPIEVDYFNGNIVLIPRYVFSILGNLDFYYTHSKGDFDYGMRAKKAGIKIVQVGVVIGSCDSHPSLDKWCNPAIPLKDRWVAMHKPNGMPPKEHFHFEKKHYGFFPAITHYLTIHIRCLCPKLWRKKKNLNYLS